MDQYSAKKHIHFRLGIYKLNNFNLNNVILDIVKKTNLYILVIQIAFRLGQMLKLCALFPNNLVVH